MEKLTNTKSIDLRQQQEITFSAAEAGLTKLSKARIFPRYLVRDSDYKIEIAGDRKSGKVIILKPERFQFTKIAIALD